MIGLRLVSLVGLFLMVALAWLMSSHRRRVPWRLVASGILLQVTLAILVLKTHPGRVTFDKIGEVFSALLSFSNRGAEFVFPGFPDSHFAFRVLPTIIFVSTLMSVLYYVGIMQWIVRGFAWIMRRTLKTSGAETLSASANIFMGQTEAPLLIKPFVAKMTRSELNAVMVGGFATIAGGVMAAYHSMGIDIGHLVTASVISAPAGLVIAKLLVPETEVSATAGDTEIEIQQPAHNVLEAAAIGAADGVRLAINVAAMLIAFTALVYLLNALVGLVGAQFGWKWSIEGALGYAFAPLALAMGVDPSECLVAGELLGIRMVLNEFVAYQRMSEYLAVQGTPPISERTEMILTYALCGFCNFTSIGIQIAGIGGLAPERQSELAELGLRAMIGGMLACCMTACIAGVIG